MIDAVQNVEEAQLDELCERIPPARFELDRSWAADIVEDAFGALYGNKSQYSVRLHGDALQPSVDGKLRVLDIDRRGNRIPDRHVELSLLPIEIFIGGKGR